MIETILFTLWALLLVLGGLSLALLRLSRIRHSHRAEVASDVLGCVFWAVFVFTLLVIAI